MATEAEILNLALVHLGEDTIEDVNADPAPVRLVKLRPHLLPAVDAVLVRHGWRCALEYETLQPAADVPGNWKWPAHYRLSADALRAWEVDRTTGWEWGVHVSDAGEFPVIRAAEAGDLRLSWIRRRPVRLLDAHLTDPVSLTLAARACVPIGGDKNHALKLEQLAEAALRRAIGTDSQNGRGQGVVFEDRLGALRASAP